MVGEGARGELPRTGDETTTAESGDSDGADAGFISDGKASAKRTTGSFTRLDQGKGGVGADCIARKCMADGSNFMTRPAKRSG